MKRAFTLIELLVVIAIIAILAAILFPVFAQAKLAAKKTADLSNFSQINKSILLYANDNDDHSLINDHEAGLNWFESLYPYMKSRDAFRTPAYTRKEVFSHELGQNVMPETDYSLNGLYSHGESLTSSSSPAQQIIVALRNVEAAEVDYHPWPKSGETDPATTDWENLDLYVGSDHPDEPTEDWFRERLFLTPWNDGSNFAFLDGHAKYFKWTQTVQAPLPGFHNIDRTVQHLH